MSPACCLVRRAFRSGRGPQRCPVPWFAVGIAWVSAERIGIERLRDAGAHKLDLYAASLESALGKYEYLPGVVALRSEVVALARNPAVLGLQDTP